MWIKKKLNKVVKKESRVKHMVLKLKEKSKKNLKEEFVVAESIINIFCPCAIMSAVSGYWHISLIAMGGIA